MCRTCCWNCYNPATVRVLSTKVIQGFCEWMFSTTKAANTRARDHPWLPFLFPATTHIRLITLCDQFLVDRSGVVGSIQAEVLRLLWCWLRAADHQPVEGSSEPTDIMTIGSIHEQCQRNSRSIRQETTFGPLFAAISGVGSGRGAGLQGLSSSLHPSLATPIGCLASRHTRSARPARLP